MCGSPVVSISLTMNEHLRNGGAIFFWVVGGVLWLYAKTCNQAFGTSLELHQHQIKLVLKKQALLVILLFESIGRWVWGPE